MFHNPLLSVVQDLPSYLSEFFLIVLGTLFLQHLRQVEYDSFVLCTTCCDTASPTTFLLICILHTKYLGTYLPR